MRKTAFCICENKDADQLRGNREADQRPFFAIRIVQSLYYLNPKFHNDISPVWKRPHLEKPICSFSCKYEKRCRSAARTNSTI